MAANRLCPKAAGALDRDMRLRLQPAVSMMLSKASLVHYSALSSTTRILELTMFGMVMMEAPLPNFPKYLRKWSILESEPVAPTSVPNVERIDDLYISDDSKGGCARQLLDGLMPQRCSIGILHFHTDLYAEAARPTAFPEGLDLLIVSNTRECRLLDTGTTDGTATVAVPDSLKRLTLVGNVVPACVPLALQHLRILDGESTEQLQYIAEIDGLQSFTLYECTRTGHMVYPDCLQSLTIEEGGEQTQPSIEDIGTLPAGLKTLWIASRWVNHPLGELPEGLEVLDLEDSPEFNQRLGKLPEGLRILRLGPAFTQELGRLPFGLIELTVPTHLPHALTVPAGTRLFKGT